MSRFISLSSTSRILAIDWLLRGNPHLRDLTPLLPSPPLRGRGGGGEGAPHPLPLSPEYRGEGRGLAAHPVAGSPLPLSGDPASAGSRMVNVEPLPGSLSADTSPPIRRQNFRVIARPSPVPSNLRVLEPSAW